MAERGESRVTPPGFEPGQLEEGNETMGKTMGQVASVHVSQIIGQLLY